MLALAAAFLSTQLNIPNPDALPPLNHSLSDGDYRIEPPYNPDSEWAPRPGGPTGTLYHFTFESTESKIYPGISKTQPGTVPYHREVDVYVASQCDPKRPSRFMVVQDAMYNRELPALLDNLIADRRIPPLVAIMIASGGGDAQGSERGLEYDTMSGRYAEFIEYEVIPKVESLCHIKLAKDPNWRLTMGASSGGAAALSMAWYHPEWYHRVLSYSGTFVNQQSPFNLETPHGAWEYHDHLIRENPRKPLRIWMEVGGHDIRYNDPESTYHNWVLANFRTAAVLKAKGYRYQFVFAKDAVHVDSGVVRQTLPEALQYSWR